MNFEAVLRRRLFERFERFQRTNSDLLSNITSHVCLAVVITSRTRCRVPIRKHSRHIEQHDLEIFGPVAIALQQFT